MNNLTGAFIFLSGAAVGAAVTWMTLKTKYEQIAQEEIDAVKEVYYTKKDSVKKNGEIIKDQGYSVDDVVTEKWEEEEDDMPAPYVISPDDFGDLDYETTSLDYYADGILVDESGEVVDEEEINDMIGDALEHFGEYEDDSVFVRDDILKIDYEILRDENPYPEEI